ncbi:peptidyl-tRNA hydrolase [Luminiphilus syltensis NOR5-1B]|uniref:Peptidyl-tRNA hydrolase n=1 Tax=Luminiphilus syltensis NOR5-1B TaxID=565045 RepID=B8KRB3_9GAMM|nr:aminoacyl-tRNA hydrolase [Luminiphilus syltensis]EED34823.1 peptidyl-tRNA hydrolase [Luminiphilus syltensis NOR5-1B]
MTAIRLIVGLGNPGSEYEGTRHNAGAFFVHALANRAGCRLSPESKFFGDTASGTINGLPLRFLIPTTFMNRSGKAVAAMAHFFKINPEEILIAHDELDIPPGQARFKHGGGHGGHNGLRDIIPALGGSKDFYRLRVGIGHPGHASKVSGYVLRKPGAGDRDAIAASIDAAIEALPKLLAGDMVKAMTQLHSFQYHNDA